MAQSVQLQLFKSKSKAISREDVDLRDPNFASNKTLPLHRWVPWIAGFSSAFVRSVIERSLPTRGVVLDPFAGVGTTLVEAELLGHDVIGFEINPYAALTCQVKLDARTLDAPTFAASLDRLFDFYYEAIDSDYKPRSTPPAGFRTRRDFYSPLVLRKVLTIQDFISSIEDERTQQAFQVAFAATMVRYSNYSYEPSLGTRKAAGKDDIEDFPVIEVVGEKLGQMLEDLEWLEANGPGRQTDATVINASFFAFEKHIPPASVDLAITSPPYLNNYHYIRNTRPHLYWLGFAEKPKDTKTLEENNFGKYWQTVRDLDEVPLDFPDPPADLVAELAYLRTLNPEKGVYGGNGWANYAASYFNDCYRFAQGLRYALRPGGSAFVVIGNSILQGVMIPTDRYLGEIAARVGLQLVDIHEPRETRVGNSIIQSDVRVGKAKSSHRLYESVVELYRPR